MPTATVNGSGSRKSTSTSSTAPLPEPSRGRAPPGRPPGRHADTVCRFLGVEPGLVTDIPARNVGGYVPPSMSTEVLRTLFRRGAQLGSHFPPQVWRKASLPLQWLIQRTPQHRPDLAEGDRAQLVSYFYDDITIVEEETGWDLDAWRTYRVGGTYSVRKSWAPSRRLVS